LKYARWRKRWTAARRACRATTITKLSADHQQKLDAANRQIEALKVTIAGLQKVVADLQASQKQMADEMKKPEPAKGAIAPAAKEGAK
jgi:predicted  nucleic acid-binding Zn-ribbon protein